MRALWLVWLTVAAPAAAAPGAAGLAGVYRCQEAAFDGRPAACGPDLVLSPDGSYSMGGRRGTFAPAGTSVRFSKLGEAALTGPGTLSFSWINEGRRLDAKFVRDPAAQAVPVALAVRFAEPAAAYAARALELLLEPEDGAAPLRAPAALDGQGVLRAQFASVPAGRAYTIVAAAGDELRAVGILDLRASAKPVVYELTVK